MCVDRAILWSILDLEPLMPFCIAVSMSKIFYTSCMFDLAAAPYHIQSRRVHSWLLPGSTPDFPRKWAATREPWSLISRVYSGPQATSMSMCEYETVQYFPHRRRETVRYPSPSILGHSAVHQNKHGECMASINPLSSLPSTTTPHSQAGHCCGAWLR